MNKTVFSLLFAAMLLPSSVRAEGGTKTVMAVDEVSYSVDKSSSELDVQAKGTVNSSGWKNAALILRDYDAQPADGILDLDFVAEAPEGIVAWVLKPITGEVRIPLEPWMKGVRVHAAKNKKEVVFSGAGEK